MGLNILFKVTVHNNEVAYIIGHKYNRISIINIYKGRKFFLTTYSGVRVIASRILHEICLLIGELAIRETKLTLNARLGTKSNLLIEQFLLGEHYCR